MLKDYIGISEDRIKHCLGVARKCYEIATMMEFNEEFCKKMYLIGYLHDVGYEFSCEKSEHPAIGADMLKTIGFNCEAIRYHGIPGESSDYKDENGNIVAPLYMNIEWTILNIADMTTDSCGREVSVFDRLKEIERKFGVDSKVYEDAKRIAFLVHLIDENGNVLP